MPHHKSSKKRLRQDVVRNMRNRQAKSRCRTLEKKFRASLAEGDRETAGADLVAVQKALDQASDHKILKATSVARKKSQLMKLYNQAATS